MNISSLEISQLHTKDKMYLLYLTSAFEEALSVSKFED